MNSPMQILLPPAASLMSAGHWSQLLASRIANTSSLEWTMRLQRCASEGNAPCPRFDSGIPMARHWIGVGATVWLSARDVATWLTTMGYRVDHEEPVPIVSPAEPDLATPSAGAPDARAWPLTSREIAHAFDGLRDWNQKRWSKALGDQPDWLAAARVTPGQRGQTAATWNPIAIASTLISGFGVQVRSVRARFQTIEDLRPWLPAWNEHEATYLPGK